VNFAEYSIATGHPQDEEWRNRNGGTPEVPEEKRGTPEETEHTGVANRSGERAEANSVSSALPPFHVQSAV
jgi:hypothetical protein